MSPISHGSLCIQRRHRSATGHGASHPGNQHLRAPRLWPRRGACYVANTHAQGSQGLWECLGLAYFPACTPTGTRTPNNQEARGRCRRARNTARLWYEDYIGVRFEPRESWGAQRYTQRRKCTGTRGGDEAGWVRYGDMVGRQGHAPGEMAKWLA